MSVLLAALGPALVAAIVPLIVALVRAGVAKMPSWLVPILAGALGPAVDSGLAFLTTHQSTSTMGGVLLGLAGVGVREVVNQVSTAATPAK